MALNHTKLLLLYLSLIVFLSSWEKKKKEKKSNVIFHDTWHFKDLESVWLKKYKTQAWQSGYMRLSQIFFSVYATHNWHTHFLSGRYTDARVIWSRKFNVCFRHYIWLISFIGLSVFCGDCVNVKSISWLTLRFWETSSFSSLMWGEVP